MQLRPEVWPKAASLVRAASPEEHAATEAYNTVGICKSYSRIEDRAVWRFLDEPLAWREVGTGRLLREDEIPVGVITQEQKDARKLQDDKQLVAAHLGKALSQGEPAEDRGGYRLISCGDGLYSVETFSGVALTPGPVGEQTAREVLALLAPEEAPPPSFGDEMAAKEAA